MDYEEEYKLKIAELDQRRKDNETNNDYWKGYTDGVLSSGFTMHEILSGNGKPEDYKSFKNSDEAEQAGYTWVGVKIV